MVCIMVTCGKLLACLHSKAADDRPHSQYKNVAAEQFYMWWQKGRGHATVEASCMEKKSIKNFQLLSSKQSKHNIADALAQTPHSYACHPPSNTCTVISVAAYALRFRQYLWISQPIHQKVLMMHTFPKIQSESTSEVRTCRFLLVRVRVVSSAL